MKTNFELLSEETNRILEINSKINKRFFLTESTPRNLTVTVKDGNGELVVGATVYDPDNSSKVNGATDANGNVVLKHFSGDKITVAFVGFETQTVTIDNLKTSVEVILKQGSELKTAVITATKIAKIQVIDSKSKKPIGNLKVILTNKKDDSLKEVYTDDDGIFKFDYDTYKTSVNLGNETSRKVFNLEKKEGETIESDKIFKTIRFENYIQVKLQLKDSQTNELIPITQDVLDKIKIIIDDESAINSKVEINEILTEIGGDEIILDFNPLYISDSTKLIVKLGGYLASSVPLTSKPTGPVVVTLTEEPEPVKTGKLPKGIRLGDIYESENLYRTMRQYLGLCGEPYQQK
jgi:5-hydroxyisourate hydrolase-like protein (transthyretin family)